MRFEIMVTMGMTISLITHALFGKIDDAFIVLLILMCIDYLTGFLIGIMGKSPKSKNGGVSSYVSWKGIGKKVLTMMLVAVAHQVDVALDVEYVMDVVMYGLMANEIVSILENYSLTGGYIPSILNTMIDVLKEKGEKRNEH